jgi:hypothetical protein
MFALRDSSPACQHLSFPKALNRFQWNYHWRCPPQEPREVSSRFALVRCSPRVRETCLKLCPLAVWGGLCTQCVRKSACSCAHSVYGRRHVHVHTVCMDVSLFKFTQCVRTSACSCAHNVYGRQPLHVHTMCSDVSLFMCTQCVWTSACSCAHNVYGRQPVHVNTMYRVRQANFLFHMAFHIPKRKLAGRTLYKDAGLLMCTQCVRTPACSCAHNVYGRQPVHVHTMCMDVSLFMCTQCLWTSACSCEHNVQGAAS